MGEKKKDKKSGRTLPGTYTLNWTVRLRYSGEKAYPAPPTTAVAAPHLTAPTAAPRVATHCASRASALSRALCARMIQFAWVN